MESLAFNIMARIDDVIYVDDATKQCAAAESMSLFNRGGLDGRPMQKRMSPSPFSIHGSSFASPFGTPTYSASSPVSGSPGRAPSALKRSNLKEAPDQKLEKPLPIDFERVRLYTGNLSSLRVPGDAPERDWLWRTYHFEWDWPLFYNATTEHTDWILSLLAAGGVEFILSIVYF